MLDSTFASAIIISVGVLVAARSFGGKNTSGELSGAEEVECETLRGCGRGDLRGAAGNPDPDAAHTVEAVVVCADGEGTAIAEMGTMMRLVCSAAAAAAAVVEGEDTDDAVAAADAAAGVSSRVSRVLLELLTPPVQLTVGLVPVPAAGDAANEARNASSTRQHSYGQKRAYQSALLPLIKQNMHKPFGIDQ